MKRHWGFRVLNAYMCLIAPRNLCTPWNPFANHCLAQICTAYKYAVL